VARKPSLAFARIRAEVFSAAESVPRGRVTTYGAIAGCLEVSARHVAYVLAGLDSDQSQRIPWHRVVGEGGALRLPTPEARARQASRLRVEGVKVSRDGVVKDFDAIVFRWPARPDRPGQATRGPYSAPSTPPLFARSLEMGYPPPTIR
jgi:methylated-DNA-protein-cysteine methyltransferase-like protein